MYELFGTRFDEVEFLGSFVKPCQLFKALDEFVGLGYENVKWCKFDA